MFLWNVHNTYMVRVTVSAVITHRTKSITRNGCRHDGNIPTCPRNLSGLTGSSCFIQSAPLTAHKLNITVWWNMKVIWCVHKTLLHGSLKQPVLSLQRLRHWSTMFLQYGTYGWNLHQWELVSARRGGRFQFTSTEQHMSAMENNTFAINSENSSKESQNTVPENDFTSSKLGTKD